MFLLFLVIFLFALIFLSRSLSLVLAFIHKTHILSYIPLFI